MYQKNRTRILVSTTRVLDTLVGDWKMYKNLVKPKNDYVFKNIFGTKDMEDVLLAFVNEVVKETQPKPFTKLTVFNPSLDKTRLTEKSLMLDIRAASPVGEQINIEIQLRNEKNITKRTLQYWSRLYNRQLRVGDKYQELKKTITINIIDFVFINNKWYHNPCKLLSLRDYQTVENDIEVHFLELPKTPTSVYSNDNLVLWLTFIKGVATADEWKELCRKMPEMKKAFEKLVYISHDEEQRILAEQREQAWLDYNSDIYDAKEEGKEEGRKEEKVATAKKLLAIGMDMVMVMQVTGLSKEDIIQLQMELPEQIAAPTKE